MSRLRQMAVDYIPCAVEVNIYLHLTAYHFCGAVSHLKTLKRGGGKCALTKRVVSFSRLVTFSQ
jgi:hypothetical protein